MAEPSTNPEIPYDPAYVVTNPSVLIIRITELKESVTNAFSFESSAIAMGAMN